MSKWKRRLSIMAAAALSVAGLAVVSATAAHAACTTYYVSNSGSDSNSGCSTSAP